MSCPIKLDKAHCENCFFVRSGKCEYERIMRDEHTKAETEA